MKSNNNNNNKKSRLQEILANAEKIQSINTFCDKCKEKNNYPNEETKKFCEEWEKELLLSMARGITNNESFYNNTHIRKSFRAGFGEW